jgi:hypothetical protein
MNVRLILIGMVAGLVVPLVAANARAVFDPGVTRTGAGADLERGAAPTAENYWRTVDEDNDHKGDNDRKCDKSPSKDDDCDHGDKDHHNDPKGDNDHKGDNPK